MSDYTERVEHALHGLHAVSTGFCPGCPECKNIAGGAEDIESHFSWSACGICGTRLGGNREVWHGVTDDTQEVLHFDDACDDCVMYLANGEEPEGAS